MDLFQIITILITLAALFSYLNYRYLRLPQTIGIMLIALGMSVTLIALHQVGGSGEQCESSTSGYPWTRSSTGPILGCLPTGYRKVSLSATGHIGAICT